MVFRPPPLVLIPRRLRAMAQRCWWRGGQAQDGHGFSPRLRDLMALPRLLVAAVSGHDTGLARDRGCTLFLGEDRSRRDRQSKDSP